MSIYDSLTGKKDLAADDLSMIGRGMTAQQLYSSNNTVTLIEKNITANGTYNASSDNADGYSKVNVNVANSYTAADEGKVVSDGTLVLQTARADNIIENGVYDTTLNNSVNVNVANSYTAADEGKVVSNGALVVQTARANNITENGTYDTTLNNSVTVNVQSGSGTYEALTCVTSSVINSSGFILNFSDNYVQYVFAHVVFEVSENVAQVDFTYPAGFTPLATSSSKRFGSYNSNYSTGGSGVTLWNTGGSTNLDTATNTISIRAVSSGTGTFGSGYKYTFPMLFRVT